MLVIQVIISYIKRCDFFAKGVLIDEINKSNAR